MIVFGSGGHTTEMLFLIKDFNFEVFKHIYFVVAQTDKNSKSRILEFIANNQVKFFFNK